jgi:hypothetical protein
MMRGGETVITTPDKQRAVLLTIGLCCIDAVMKMEEPHSFVHNKLSAACTNLAKATDDYVSHSFQGEDMEKALEVYEATNRHVKRLFRTPRVKRTTKERVRGRDGRFVVSGA